MDYRSVAEKLSCLLDHGVRYGLAFSGGCDSALLLALLVRGGYDVVPYTMATAFQASFELDDARRVAEIEGVELMVLEENILAQQDVCANAPDRCYRCKRFMFERILREMGTAEAAHGGVSVSATRKVAAKAVAAPVARSGTGRLASCGPVLLDGTNASDDPVRRPGMRALAELGVVSPLRELGLTKDDVRALSRELGLFTADKPSFSCYATRIPHGVHITADALAACRDGAPEGSRHGRI